MINNANISKNWKNITFIKTFIFTSITGALIGWVTCVGGREFSRLWTICTGVPVIYKHLTLNIFKYIYFFNWFYNSLPCASSAW